jgi:phytanoyl-CoA hydroxylase
MMAPLDSIAQSIKRFLPASLKTQIRGLIGKTSQPARPRRWVARPESSPWFDRPDALEVLEKRSRSEALSDADYDYLHQWASKGYFVVRGLISHRLIDPMMRDLDGLWTADKPHEGFDIDGLRVGSETPAARVSHSVVCAMAPSLRAAARDRSNWRIVDFPRVSESAKRIFTDPELMRLASLIFGRSAEPRYALNFMYGSTQTEHQDTAVFHIFPPNYIAGAWIACEDISPVQARSCTIRAHIGSPCSLRSPTILRPT